MNDLTRVKLHNPARLFRDALSLPAAFFRTLSHCPPQTQKRSLTSRSRAVVWFSETA